MEQQQQRSAFLLQSNRPRRFHYHRHHRLRVPILVSTAVLVGLASGTLYGFGRYSLALKDRLGFGQLEVQQLGVLLDCGNYVGHPLTGLAYDRRGPRASCVAAAFVVCAGYCAIALAISLHDGNDFDGTTNNNSNSDNDDNGVIVLNLCRVGFLSVGFGSGLGYVSALGSVTREFRGQPAPGRAVAATAAGYGLSSTLVGASFRRAPDLRDFFLFWAAAAAVVYSIGAFVFGGREAEREEQRGLLASGDDDIAMADGEDDEDGSGSSSASADGDTLGERDARDERRSAPSRSWTAWRRWDYWMLFASFACVTGCGLLVINNLSTMVQSIGEPDSLASDLLLLLSISNVGGRILMGVLSDLPRYVHDKIDLLQGVAAVMLCGLLTSTIPTFQEGDRRQSVCLAVTVVSVATAYGGSWVLIVGILADLYGRENFGKDYGLMAMGPAISGLVFNSASALVYEKHAEADGDTDGKCFGNGCYRGSYWMAAAAALTGSLILCQMRRIPTTARSSTIR